MKRTICGRQFKMAAAEQAQVLRDLPRREHENRASALKPCVAGSTNRMNMERVRFRVMEAHFLISRTRVRNYKSKLKN